VAQALQRDEHAHARQTAATALCELSGGASVQGNGDLDEDELAFIDDLVQLYLADEKSAPEDLLIPTEDVQDSKDEFRLSVYYGAIGDSAARALKGNPDVKSRLKAATLLGKFADLVPEHAVHALKEAAFKEENENVRLTAAKYLGKLYSNVLQSLQGNPDVKSRLEAATLLGELANLVPEHAVFALKQASKVDENENVRLTAAKYLGKIRSNGLQALQGNPDVKSRLGKIQSNVVQALQGNPDVKSRLEAATLLGEFADLVPEHAVPALKQASKEDENENVRLTAAKYLGKIQSNAVQALQGNPDVNVQRRAVVPLREILRP